MRAPDTNVLARFFVDDAEDAQAAQQRPAAVAALAERSLASVTVLLELERVMRGFYELPTKDISRVLRALASIEHVTLEDRDAVLAAIDDFDMVSISPPHCIWRAVRVPPGSRHSTSDWRSGPSVSRWRYPWSCWPEGAVGAARVRKGSKLSGWQDTMCQSAEHGLVAPRERVPFRPHGGNGPARHRDQTAILGLRGGTVAASITAIPMGIDNVYLVKGERSIVVDGGQPGKFGPFARKLRQAGVSPSDIGLIVATHGHWDHIGCLAEMKQYTCAPLAMHAGDRNSIEAPNAVMPPGVTPWGRFLSALLSATVIPWLKIPAASVDVIVPDDGMSLEPYGVSGRVLHTPGHTPGSVSIVLPSGDALVGDLAMNRIPLRLSPGLPIFAEDMAQLKRSIEKLLAAGAKTIYPAHGKPFPANVLKSAVAAM